MELKATMLAPEDRPISVAFGNVSTLGALLRGISGIDKGNGNTLGQGLILNKTLEHGKSPAMYLPIALSPKISPAADVGQFLKDNNGAIVGGSVAYQPLAGLVQCIPVEAVLPLANSLKSSLSAPGAFALKGTPHPEVVVSAPVEPSSLEEFIGASYCDILNPQIHPDNLTGRSRRWDKLLQHKVKVENLISINKVSRAKLPGLILKIASLIITKDKFAPHAVPIGREGAVVRFDSAGSGIVADGSKGKMGLGAFSFKATLHRLGHLITAGASEVGRKAKKLSGLIVNLVVEGYFIGESLLPSSITNPVAGIGICHHCLKEKVVIFGNKLYSYRSGYLLHIHILAQYRQFVKREVGRLPLPAKASSLRRPFL